MYPSPAGIEFLESIIYGGRKDPLAKAVRAMLIALSGLYRAAIWVYLLPFEIGFRRQRKLDSPVVSVGNITVGGTGKSPTVEYLCKGLLGQNWKPAVLSYGYGGSLRGKFAVVSDGSSVSLAPREAGDEPVMLATNVPGVPVLVCRDRVKSGRIAVGHFGADILVLDDGFQVWKVHRDLDIVLLNADNPLDNGRTLPAGRLREPLTALRRADCIVATGIQAPREREDILTKVLRAAPTTPVYFGRFCPSVVISLSYGSESPVERIRGKKVFALSSIANPASFEKTLTEAGAVIVGREALPDHHLYAAKDIARINRGATEGNAELVVTTDKDAVKLDARQFTVPVMRLGIELKLDDETGFWEFVARRIGRPPGPNKSRNAT